MLKTKNHMNKNTKDEYCGPKRGGGQFVTYQLKNNHHLFKKKTIL